jgi:hypothetical protein
VQWSRPSHRPPQRRPTLLLRACTIYALGGEWREPVAEDKLCVPVQRQAHTRTRAYVCKPMRSPGEEIPRKAGCRRERTTKRLQMEASIIAHAWLMPGSRQQFFLVVRETFPKEHLSVIRSERQIFSLALLTGRATPNIQGSARGKRGRGGAWNIHARHQHG